MKQIHTSLTRAFSGKEPLPSSKWKAFIRNDEQFGKVLYLYHYHHQVLVYFINEDRIVKEWWEKNADKRGLESAKSWLLKRQEGRLS